MIEEKKTDWGVWYTTYKDDALGFKQKLLIIEPTKSISLQKHFQRDEYWTIISGTGVLCLFSQEDEFIELEGGDSVRIESGEIHKIFNTSQTEKLYISEIQIAAFGGACIEEDIIRLDESQYPEVFRYIETTFINKE